MCTLKSRSPYTILGSKVEINFSSKPRLLKISCSWCTYTCGGIELGETNSSGRHSIQVRDSNGRMPETGEITIAKIIRKDCDKLGLRGGRQ